jgi:hypothetical protein
MPLFLRPLIERSVRREVIYAGSIKDAVLLTTTDAPVIQFIYGTIVYDLSERFSLAIGLPRVN